MSEPYFIDGSRKFMNELIRDPRGDVGLFALRHIGAVLWDESADGFLVVVQGLRVFIGKDEKAYEFEEDFRFYLDALSQEIDEDNMVIRRASDESD